ncbi:LysE family translocator [Haloparvum sedimenti]|uniref:LysE family translocator n=1 Tax=Haloparvum sedimenti TaxID=1678448 RepID=UPI00071E7190|nr:LysE family translocator [Haloparvum sedimenti]
MALPDPATYLLFLSAAVALILAPGPDTLFVLSQGVQSRGLGVRAALGVAVGVLFHTVLAVLGLAAVYRTVPAAADAVRLFGGAYLALLGAVTLRNAGGEEAVGGGEAENRAATAAAPGGFRRGFLVNAANPQVALFFLALLPGFVEGPDRTLGMAVLGGTYAVLTAGYLAAVATAADAATSLVGARSTRVLLDRVAGAVLIGLGAWVALG